MSAQLPVSYALEAQRELDEIAEWNAKHYGSDHAARYIDFLQSQIEQLCQDSKRSHVVPLRLKLRYVMIRRRKTSGHGHIAIYRQDDDAIYVLHVFHSAQDWQQRLIDETSPE